MPDDDEPVGSRHSLALSSSFPWREEIGSRNFAWASASSKERAAVGLLILATLPIVGTTASIFRAQP